MRRLLLALCAVAARGDAEDDLDHQLQVFAGRYMFATDGQIATGLDREMDDLTLGFRKQRQKAQRVRERRSSRASLAADDDLNNYMLNAIDVGDDEPRGKQQQKARAPVDPDDQWRVAIPRDEMFDAPVIPAGNPRRHSRGPSGRAQATINQLDVGDAPRRHAQARRGRRAQEEVEYDEDREEDDGRYYDDEEGEEYYDDEEEDEGEYYDDEYEEPEVVTPQRVASSRRRTRQRPSAGAPSRGGSRRRASARAPAPRRDEPIDGAIEALDVGLDPAAEQAIGRASGIMRDSRDARRGEETEEADDEPDVVHAASPRASRRLEEEVDVEAARARGRAMSQRRWRGRRLAGSPSHASGAHPPPAHARPQQQQQQQQRLDGQLERQPQPPPPRDEAQPPEPWGFGNGAAGGSSDAPAAKAPVDIWGKTTARNCNAIQFDYTEGVDSCGMCQHVAESWFRSETVCHCYKSKRGDEFHAKCEEMLGQLKAKQDDLKAEAEDNGWSDMYRSFGSCEFINICPGS